MHLVDHIFILLLFVAQPIHGWIEFRRYVAAVKAGKPADRIGLYRQTASLEWVAVAVLLVSWVLLARPLPELGFVMPGGSGFWLSLLAGVLVLAWLLHNGLKIRDLTNDECGAYRRQLGDLELFLPRNNRELKNFYGLSITAGVVEEIIFRGFVLWYLAQLMPLWAAAVVSSIGFGLGHSYQGPGGMLRTGAVGLAFAALYIASGSIWLPIVLHALFDILQGWQIRQLYRDGDDNGPAAETA